MPKTLSLKVSIVTEIPRVYEDFFFDEASSLLFGPVAGGGWEGKGKADCARTSWVVIKRREQGSFRRLL